MTYSALERFHDALKGEPQDRVPIFPMNAAWAAVNFSDSSPAELAKEPQSVVETQIRAMEAVGYDAFFAYADPLYIPQAFGCKVRFLETGPLSDPLPLAITRPEDLDKLPVPDPRKEERLAATLEIIQGLGAYGAGNIPVLGLFEGPITTTCRIFEAELIMRMIYKNPQVLEAILDRVTAFLIEFSQALIENGANVIFLPEPTASAAMISPAAFRKFVLPRLQTITAKLDVPCILHICGDTAPVLDSMGQTGADVLSLDQCMDLAESRSAVPDAVLGGNVDPINSLLNGSPEQIAADTLNCLRTAGTSRFILMSGCGVPPRTPVEKVAAMIKTAKAYGLGPSKS
ncbi:MAG: uroporphyrinogen decarboxylase family protein [Desulfobacterales bacterium]|jgi:MtaA/CmuA family methyltransferase